MKSCDVLFVINYFRSAMPLLAALRALAGEEKRVAVCFAPLDRKTENKTGGAQRQFEALCEASGAVRIEPGEAIGARLMIVQQGVYDEGFVRSILAGVKAERKLGSLMLASAGIEKHDAFIRQFGLTRLMAQDAKLIAYLAGKRGASAFYETLSMIEVGLPFRAHPIFPDFKADWIVAAPTLFSFHSEDDKQDFLRDVLALLGRIPATDEVVYKSHNGNLRDYFTPRLYDTLAACLTPFAGSARWIGAMARRLPGFWAKPLKRIETGILHRLLLARARPMGSVTPYADLSIEAFLPGVRKGVVGGLSNTIWGCLFFGVPYYNCVRGENRSGPSDLLNKSSTALLDLNLTYFGVPFCGGDPAQGARNEEIVFKPGRHKDIVEVLREEMSA